MKISGQSGIQEIQSKSNLKLIGMVLLMGSK